MTSTLTSDASEATGPEAGDGAGSSEARTRRWAIWSAVAIFAVGAVWFGLSRGAGPSVASTVASCTQGLENDVPSTPATSIQTGVVGLGSVASIATFDTPTGEAWCFSGMGTGLAGITVAQMHAALAAPVEVMDGTLTNDVLLLVHLGQKSASVVVATADGRSSVLAKKNGFEVLRVPTTGWPSASWHEPWSRHAVALGRIIAYDKEGRVTASMPFTWCPGGINNSPGTGC